MTNEEAAARLVATRIEQGLPERVEDPVALRKITDTLVASVLAEADATTPRTANGSV